jgi:aspartate/methionine/tyrosine aminotransferase
VTFCTVAPAQEAVSLALETAETRGYYTDLQAAYSARMEKLMGYLERANLHPIRPQGTFFIMSDISGLGFKDDVDFARYVTAEVGVAGIPPSSFYHDPADGANLCRWCFAKTDANLEAAGERLLRWAQGR